jgi:hypothetical protein
MKELTTTCDQCGERIKDGQPMGYVTLEFLLVNEAGHRENETELDLCERCWKTLTGFLGLDQ